MICKIKKKMVLQVLLTINSSEIVNNFITHYGCNPKK